MGNNKILLVCQGFKIPNNIINDFTNGNRPGGENNASGFDAGNLE